MAHEMRVYKAVAVAAPIWLIVVLLAGLGLRVLYRHPIIGTILLAFDGALLFAVILSDTLGLADLTWPDE